MRRITFSTAHRLILLTLLVTGLLIAVMVAVTSQMGQSSPAEDPLGRHYQRLIRPAVAALNQAEINRVLASMAEDDNILRAAVFSASGERIAQQGVTTLLPQLIREEPLRTSFFVPVKEDDKVVGYLHWVREPNKAK